MQKTFQAPPAYPAKRPPLWPELVNLLRAIFTVLFPSAPYAVSQGVLA